MYYLFGNPLALVKWIKSDVHLLAITDIPAWSLSALLEVMPSNIGDYDLYITKHKYVDGGHGYNVEYNRGFTISVLHKGTSRDLVAAAYEMVCWLLDHNAIKNIHEHE